MERPNGNKDEQPKKVTGEDVYRYKMQRLDTTPGAYPDDVSDMAMEMFEIEADIMNERNLQLESEPKPNRREVTGEIVYLDKMRQSGQKAEKYPDDLSQVAVDIYENTAELMRSQHARPAILDEYERYDERDELSQSCTLLAEELLALKRPDSDLTFEDYIVDGSAADVLTSLKSIRAGKVLAGDGKQLAIKSNGEHYPILDIKKKDAELTGVNVRVWGWSDRKYLFTNKDDEPYQYPRDFLQYPSDEKSHWYELEVSFSYNHPEAGYFSEKATLSIGQRGDLRIGSQVWVSAYAETGYEGHDGKELHEPEDEDLAAFADVIAKIVGDEPEAVWHYQERKLAQYIDSVPNALAKKYLGEWLYNGYAEKVLRCLQSISVENKTLSNALKDDELVGKAIEVLADMVNEDRTRRNKIAANSKRSMELFGRETEPWQDFVERQEAS